MAQPHNILFLTGVKNSHYGLSRPLGAYRVATILEENFPIDVNVVDFVYRWTYDEIVSLFEKYINNETLAICISTTFLSVLETPDGSGPDEYRQLINKLKTQYPNLKLIVGGANSLTWNIDADIYVVGYADTALVDLFKNLIDGTNSFKHIKNPDGSVTVLNTDYPEPQMDGLIVKYKENQNIQPYEWLPIEISRGCIFKCAFCNHPLLGKKKLDYIKFEKDFDYEFRRNYEMFGTTSYSFMDDTYNDTHHKLNILLNVSKKLPFDLSYACYGRLDLVDRYPDMLDIMVETGLKAIHFGIETFDRNAGKIIGKGQCDKHKDTLTRIKEKYPFLKVMGTLIIGLPGETTESIMSSVEWMESTKMVDFWYFYALTIKDSGLIGQRPEKYGYKIWKDPGEEVYEWSSDILDYRKARILQTYLEKRSLENGTFSGFWVPGVSSVNENSHQYVNNPIGPTMRDPNFIQQVNDRLNEYKQHWLQDN